MNKPTPLNLVLIKKIFLCAVIFIVTSCVLSKEKNHKNTSESYLPLKIGNEWVYSDTSGREGYSISWKITGDTLINNTHYFIHTQYFERGESYSYYIREDSFGNIFLFEAGLRNYKIDISKIETGSYDLQICDGCYDYEVTVTSYPKFETPAGTFENCAGFYFDSNIMADEEVGYTLCKNVGIVQISGAWIPNLHLNSFTIN